MVGELIGVATAENNGLMPKTQFFDRNINAITDYNTFKEIGFRRTLPSTLNSPFINGDGQEFVAFLSSEEPQKIGIQFGYNGTEAKLRLYWAGSWGPWRTVSLTS